MARPIVITGGGTGGHIMPMVAIADALQQQGVDAFDIVFVGSRRGQERNLLSGRPERLITLPGRGLRRSFVPLAVVNNLGALARVVWSILVSVWLVLRLRPRAVVSVGGYAAFPMVAATVIAARPRRRLFLVELDATPGLVHRIVAPVARSVMFGMEPTHPRSRSRVVGVPLRESIENLSRTVDSVAEAKKARGIPATSLSVVVMTGSLGSRRVNEAVVELATAWKDRHDVFITHVTGRRDFHDIERQAQSATGSNYTIVPFEEDMPSLWAATDVAICRAGAATLAELTYLGIPSVLVPLPHAPSDHQTHNAQSLEQRGAAVVIADRDCTATSLARALDTLASNESRRLAMGRAASTLRRGGAAGRIAEVVIGAWPPRHVHVVGAGGAGMSGVVRYFAEAGSIVSGSDRAASRTLTDLQRLGVFTSSPQVAAARAASLLTWSPAVDPTSDPDVLAGEGQKVTRADLLAVISRHHTNLAITGTHGKTTASSMLVHIALAARWHPSWLIGADIRGAGNNGHFDGDTLIMELDESYGSFRETVPQGLAILNIEADHLDHYGSLENLEAAFAEIATHTVGPVVYFSDSVAPRVVAGAQTTHSVGFDETAKWQITEYHSSREGSSCLVRHRDSSVVLSISLRVPGRHNVINASVAAVLAHLYGATPSDIERGLAAFQGAPRRFEIRGRIDRATLVDDYAHLPSEVSATLAAARDTGADRVLAVFQPHRITRTTSLAEEFGPAFDRATDVIVTDIYDAGEPNPDGVTGELVARAIERHGVVPVTYVSALDALEDVIRRRATHYDMVVVMGAGDIATTVDRLAGDE